MQLHPWNNVTEKREGIETLNRCCTFAARLLSGWDCSRPCSARMQDKAGTWMLVLRGFIHGGHHKSGSEEQQQQEAGRAGWLHPSTRDSVDGTW